MPDKALKNILLYLISATSAFAAGYPANTRDVAKPKVPEVPQKLRDAKPVVIHSTDSNANTVSATKKVIFIDFYNESNNADVKWLADSIGESIYELTKNKYQYTRLPNKIWRDYAAAHQFKSADFYDTEKLQAMGYALKIDGIVFGKFTAHETNIEITGKILSVVDRDIIAEKNVTVPFSSQMFEDVQVVSETLGSRIKDLFFPSDRGALWRSSLLPGWGQFYKQRKTWGYVYGGVVGSAAAFSLFSFIMLQTSKSAYRNYDPDHVVTPQGEFGIKDPAAARAEFDRLGQVADQWYQITIISASITLAFYLWNLFDAWFFEGNYTVFNQTASRPLESFLGADIRIGSDREPMSLRIGFAF